MSFQTDAHHVIFLLCWPRRLFRFSISIENPKWTFGQLYVAFLHLRLLYCSQYIFLLFISALHIMWVNKAILIVLMGFELFKNMNPISFTPFSPHLSWFGYMHFSINSHRLVINLSTYLPTDSLNQVGGFAQGKWKQGNSRSWQPFQLQVLTAVPAAPRNRVNVHRGYFKRCN